MEYTAFATCSRCGQTKVQMEGGITQCLLCESKPENKGTIVTTIDPGHDELEKVLAKAGVAKLEGGKFPNPIKSTPCVPIGMVQNAKSEVIVKNEAKMIPISSISGIDQALAILRSLPMPKDLKQFKAISKAIKILENLGV